MFTYHKAFISSNVRSFAAPWISKRYRISVHVLKTSLSIISTAPLPLGVVVVVITPPLPRDRGTALTSIQVHAVNLIEIRLGERWQPISNQS